MRKLKHFENKLIVLDHKDHTTNINDWFYKKRVEIYQNNEETEINQYKAKHKLLRGMEKKVELIVLLMLRIIEKQQQIIDMAFDTKLDIED